MLVFVLNRCGKPLMPCNSRRARLLLDQKKVKVVRRTPFTIQFFYGCSGYQQPISLGVDAGYKSIGLSAAAEKKVLFEAEVELRNDMVELLSERRELRRSRRSRNTRYRQPRFDNRKRRDGWLAPSVENKIDQHLKAITLVHDLLPVTRTAIEVAQFDIQQIKHPAIQGQEYQQGEQLGFWNVREYVLFRDGHRCRGKQGCHNSILNVHHLESRRTGGDAPGNLVTLCERCHQDYHEGRLKLDLKRDRSFKAETFMGVMRWTVYDRLKRSYPNVNLTYGYITKSTRIAAGLEKSHRTDARCISGNPSAKLDTAWYFFRQMRAQNRRLHKLHPSRGGLRKANKARRYLLGFQLFDKVLFGSRECFIFGRRSSGYFDLRTLAGTRVHASANFKDLMLLERANTLLCERRNSAFLSPRKEAGVSCA